MNLSRNWLSDFVNTDGIDNQTYCDKLTITGSKVEGFEVLGEEIENVVVAKVTAMEKHPDSDHLWICKVDAGEAHGHDIQIVTGAQNVFVGALVPAALPVAKLPGGVTIKAGKLRGVESSGMLCSMGELQLTAHDMPGKEENGILILDPENEDRIGEDIRDVLLLKDTSVEFEITSNRPDCLSVIGLARETAVSFDRPLTVKAPVVKGASDGDDVNKYLSVKISAPDLCYRYAARVVKNVKIAPSPLWLRMRLRACGVRPINNIVDITNYVMLEYGQPMHAFDYACLDGAAIDVRRAADGEAFRSLDDTDHTLDSSMLVIADSKKACALAGVMGGANSEIKEDTATVVFESACFNGASVRVTAKKNGMRTESSARFEKGLDPENCIPGLERACELVELLCAGEVVDGMIGEFLPRSVFAHDFTWRFLEAWRAGFSDGGDALAALGETLSPREHEWFDAILLGQTKSGASTLTSTEICQDFVRLVWIDRLKQIRGSLTATGDDNADRKRMKISMDLKRLNSVKWHTIKDLVREWIQEGE